MIRINQLTLPVGHGPGALKKKAAKLLGIPETAVAELIVVRRSVDARKKDRLLFSYIADVRLADEKREQAIVNRAKNINIMIERERPYRYPKCGDAVLSGRPVIVGAGPAGLFAALALAENGFRPLILEQGDAVEERVKKVEAFWHGGDKALDLRSNVQFGEGGAGTFSDGKLNTLVKDVSGRNRKVLETFAEAGADASILYDAKPHIGTDVLRTVIRNIRARILDAGGEIRFGCRVSRLWLDDTAGTASVRGVVLEDGSGIESRAVILAVGHSSRELFFALKEQGVPMEAKAFAVGLRIQHPQEMIDRSQYGTSEERSVLGAAPYKVTAKTSGGRGVYSFCMCPGGYVVNASSERGRLAINGMSDFARDSRNANSALIVTVGPEDLYAEADAPAGGADPHRGASDPLAGVRFQRRLEERAFLLGDGRIPVQLYGDFRAHVSSRAFGGVEPEFCGGYAFADLRGLMPEPLDQALLEGMERFGRMIDGFDRPDAILAGIESRTSSPVRILRGEDLESAVAGLFPCGEGAGYAGGITSAARDGLKTAEELIRRYRPL